MSIEISIEEGVATVAFNRPERKNSLTMEMRGQLTSAFRQFAVDASVRSVVLRGNEAAFCAGSDVGTFGDQQPHNWRLRIKQAQEMIRSIAHLEKPVVAAVGGAAVGVGWSLALACDMIVVSPSARFSQIFRKVGLAPDGGSVLMLSQYVGVLRAKELALTARMVGGEEAMRLGLATELVVDEELHTRAHAIARELASGPTFALGMTKRLFLGAAGSNLDQFLELESHVQCQLVHTSDHAEGVRAFKEKRPARFVGN